VVASRGDSNGHRSLGVVLLALLSVVADLLIWRAAIGGFVVLIASVILACVMWRHGRWRSCRALGLGLGTLALSLAAGLAFDKLNEGAARSLAAKAVAYKTERGVYPSEEIANRWARPLLGYTQRYTLAGTDDARVWFTRYNHRLQSVNVATGQLLEERDQ
jgi:hypothetical protein